MEGLSHLRGNVWRQQQSINDTGRKTGAALASTGSRQVIARTWQAFEPQIKPVEATAMPVPRRM